VPMQPKRRWWLKWVIIVALLPFIPMGCRRGVEFVSSSFGPGKKEVPVASPVVQPSVSQAAVQSVTRRAGMEKPPEDRENRKIELVWVLGRTVGLLIDGKEYEMAMGETFGDVSVGRIGVSQADVSVGGKLLCLRVAINSRSGGSVRKPAGGQGVGGNAAPGNASILSGAS